MHVITDSSAFRALVAASDRKLEKEFKQWILQCHLQHDEEVSKTINGLLPLS